MSGTIHVNGAERALECDSVAALIAAMGIAADARGVAVAVNGAVVPRPHWPSVPLAHGDQVEVIRAMQGG